MEWPDWEAACHSCGTKVSMSNLDILLRNVIKHEEESGHPVCISVAEYPPLDINGYRY